MKRYWFEFDLASHRSPPAGVLLGCGVTAHDYDDALRLIKGHVFTGTAFPAIRNVIEDVDVSTLDTKHVLPNIGNCLARGIWFPRGCDI